MISSRANSTNISLRVCKIRTRLEALMDKPENQWCCDCSEKTPKWATIIVALPDGPANLDAIGAFCCFQCSRAHRSLGPEICFDLSIYHDEWQEKDVIAMERGGSKVMDAVFGDQRFLSSCDELERCLKGDDYNSRKKFMEDKYKSRLYYDHENLNKVIVKKPASDVKGEASLFWIQENYPTLASLPNLAAGPPRSRSFGALDTLRYPQNCKTTHNSKFDIDYSSSDSGVRRNGRPRYFSDTTHSSDTTTTSDTTAASIISSGSFHQVQIETRDEQQQQQQQQQQTPPPEQEEKTRPQSQLQQHHNHQQPQQEHLETKTSNHQHRGKIRRSQSCYERTSRPAGVETTRPRRNSSRQNRPRKSESSGRKPRSSRRATKNNALSKSTNGATQDTKIKNSTKRVNSDTALSTKINTRGLQNSTSRRQSLQGKLQSTRSSYISRNIARQPSSRSLPQSSSGVSIKMEPKQPLLLNRSEHGVSKLGSGLRPSTSCQSLRLPPSGNIIGGNSSVATVESYRRAHIQRSRSSLSLQSTMTNATAPAEISGNLLGKTELTPATLQKPRISLSPWVKKMIRSKSMKVPTEESSKKTRFKLFTSLASGEMSLSEDQSISVSSENFMRPSSLKLPKKSSSTGDLISQDDVLETSSCNIPQPRKRRLRFFRSSSKDSLKPSVEKRSEQSNNMETKLHSSLPQLSSSSLSLNGEVPHEDHGEGDSFRPGVERQRGSIKFTSSFTSSCPTSPTMVPSGGNTILRSSTRRSLQLELMASTLKKPQRTQVGGPGLKQSSISNDKNDLDGSPTTRRRNSCRRSTSSASIGVYNETTLEKLSWDSLPLDSSFSQLMGPQDD